MAVNGSRLGVRTGLDNLAKNALCFLGTAAGKNEVLHQTEAFGPRLVGENPDPENSPVKARPVLPH